MSIKLIEAKPESATSATPNVVPSSRARRVARPQATAPQAPAARAEMRPQPVARPNQVAKPQVDAETVVEAKLRAKRKRGSVVGWIVMNSLLLGVTCFLSYGASSLAASVQTEAVRNAALTADSVAKTATRSTDLTKQRMAAMDSASESVFGTSQPWSPATTARTNGYVASRR